MRLSTDLRDTLDAFDVFEPVNEQEARVEVLQQLNSLATQWIINLSRQEVLSIK